MSEHTHTRTIAGAVWRRISGGAAQQTGAVQIRNIMHDKSAAPPVYERADQAVQIRAKRVSCHTGPKRTRGFEAFVIDWVVWERLPEPDQDGDEWIEHNPHNRLIDAARAAQAVGTAAPVTLSALLAAASISTLARVCGVTPRTVGNWRAGGKVPFVAVYLIAQYTQIPIERVRPDLEGEQR